MKTKSISVVLAACATGLVLTSCKSEQEQAREEHLEQKAESLEAGAKGVRKEGEAVADMKENSADAMRKNSESAADATESSADATRKAAEKRADQLEGAADEVREKK